LLLSQLQIVANVRNVRTVNAVRQTKQTACRTAVDLIRVSPRSSFTEDNTFPKTWKILSEHVVEAGMMARRREIPRSSLGMTDGE
jgi:hypothetical protein